MNNAIRLIGITQFATRIALAFIALAFACLAASEPALAQRGQLGPQTNYSASEIASAVSNSSLNPYLKQYADQMGNLGRFESSGNAGIFNGSCCTGIFQLNTTNLANFGYTREQYANLSLQEQTNVWAQLTNSSMNSASVQSLINMQKSGQAFDGQPVDGALVMACIQLGTGNCQSMLRSGSCSGFADRNGTTICDMAQKIRSGSSTEGDPNKATTGQTGNSSSSNSSSDVQDKSPADCWGCDAVTIAFETTAKVTGALTGEIMKPAIQLFGLIFGLVVVITLGKAFFFITDQIGSTYSQLWRMTLRFAFVMLLIGSSSFYSNVVMPYVMSPVVGISADLSTKFGEYAARAFGGDQAQASCNYKQPSIDNEELKQAADQLAKTMCSVHLKMTTAIQKIAQATQKLKSHLTGVAGFLVAAFVQLLALMGMVALVSSLIVLAFQLVEGIIRMGFCITLFPLVLYLWVYKATESIFHAFMRNIVYGGALLVVASIMAGAATGMAAIMLQIAGDPGAFGTGSDMAATAKYILAMAALGAMAATMMSSAGPLATQLTNASNELASSAGGAVNAMMQGVQTGMAVIGGGASLAGSAGSLVSKLPGLAAGRGATPAAAAGKAMTNAQKVAGMSVSGGPVVKP